MSKVYHGGGDSLNPEQKTAAQAPFGPLLIVAGAGTGKTKTLTSRIAYLIERGVPAGQICAITFTNKAAQEMAERLGVERGKNDASLPFIGTFHSLGARILRREGYVLKRTSGFTIFDDHDSFALVKKILKTADPEKKERPSDIANRITSVKNGMAESAALPAFLNTVFSRYESALEKNNAFDFDDLIQKVVLIFTRHPAALAKYQNRFRHILVDEYQDVNNVQYEFVRLIGAKSQSISAVGDDQQCVPPGTKVQTPSGKRNIETLRPGDAIIVAAGNGMTHIQNVTEVKKFKYSGRLVKIITENGKEIRLTPNHIMFMRYTPREDIYYVYLIFRENKGFRIGVAMGARVSGGRSDRQMGLRVRGNQERADKMWILRVCNDIGEAHYWEAYYSFQYGVPTLVFDTGNRNMRISQKHIDTFYKNIDTRKRALSLLKDLDVHFDYPHWLPEGGTRFARERLRIRLALFDDRRKSILNPWGMSRLSINTRDTALKQKLEQAGFKTRKGKFSDWRFEMCRVDYGALEKVLDQLVSLDGRLITVRTACLTEKKRFFFQPSSHARPTMAIAVSGKDRIKEEIVKEISFENYRGWVYDLEVRNVHNYIANDFVVHNSIYGWRGSNTKLFLNFEKDWPGARCVLLEENYRSSANIIAAASALIAHNARQKPKHLWTKNAPGDPIALVETGDEAQEAEWVAEEVKKLRNEKLETTIAILYRTNAQSRALEQSLLMHEIPYRIYGGLKFYERREIKDVVSALRYAANEKDSISRERLEKTFSKTKFEALSKHLVAESDATPVQLMNIFLTSVDYFNYLDTHCANPLERRENIAELISFASQFKNLHDFLEHIALLQAHDEVAGGIGDTPPVQLMTIHLAKGLEFDHVFIVGGSEGLLPHARSERNEAEVEEERRLMYVAMTRAKQNLCVSFYDIPSRFLSELPPELLKFESLISGETAFVDSEERYITLD